MKRKRSGSCSQHSRQSTAVTVSGSCLLRRVGSLRVTEHRQYLQSRGASVIPTLRIAASGRHDQADARRYSCGCHRGLAGLPLIIGRDNGRNADPPAAFAAEPGWDDVAGCFEACGFALGSRHCSQPRSRGRAVERPGFRRQPVVSRRSAFNPVPTAARRIAANHGRVWTAGRQIQER